VTPPVRIALAQLNVTVGDLDGNVAKIAEHVDRARQCGADLVAFPELALCGYPPEDLLLRAHFVRDQQARLRKLRRAAKGLTVVVGFADRDRDGVYNAAAVLAEGRQVGVYRKMLLPNYGVFDEKRYFVPGRRPMTLSLRGQRIALTICEDIWHSPGPAEAACKAGARIVLNVSGSPYQAGKVRRRAALLRSLAKRCRATVCYLNLVGGQDELVFDGGSMVVDPAGRLVARAKQFHEDMLIADVPVQRRSASRSSTVEVVSVPGSKTAARRAAVSCVAAKPLARWQEIYHALALGTHDYVRKNGFQKVLVGLSGGIDSALTATIAADALGAANVVGVTMPSRFSSDETLSDARRLAGNLGVRLITLPIKHVHQSYLQALAEPFEGTKPDITEENIQARIRGNFLMALSNKFGWLVLTTGNKSEMSVGYCTLFGDMAGGFAVLKDVPKTWVYQLASYRNSIADEPLIPPSAIQRPPTAELRPGQRDQDSLPPYDVLDRIVDAYVEKRLGCSQIRRKGIDPATVSRVVGMIDRSEYKRRQSPPGIKITPRAFGRDRRMPITNKYTH